MQSNPRRLRILIADDSATVRLFVANAVAKSGVAAACVETGDGRSCLRQLTDGDFDIAFVDVHMPRLSGMDALAQSRRDGVGTFAVMMSTERNPGKLNFARNLGAYEYLAKPFSQQDVAAIVANYLRFTSPASVLLVDDSASARSVIRRVLAESIFNLDIDEVADGPTALVRYQARQHDIVFLDINMPGIDGLDTLVMLRKLKPDVRVVLVTADQGAVAARAQEEANFAALYKPFFAEDVDRVLHDLFGLRRPTLDDAPSEAVLVS